MSKSPTALVFEVKRSAPELIPPAAPTPREFKELSDIDDQDALRFQIPVINFYRNDEALRGSDPAKVIKEAVGRALVPYYPFAGRLREKAARKLVVECNGEGVLFIEADADVTLDEFGEEIHPPFPCFQELLYDVPGNDGILHSPLLLIQVTRLKCGGFIFAIRLNHTMTDATGLVQFLNTMADLARGAQNPSGQPVWERHLLCARDLPRVTHAHREYDELVDNTKCTPLDDLVHKSFFFGAKEMWTLRQLLPPHLKSATTFEVLSACIWQCRTIALELDPNDEVRFLPVVNARSVFNPPLSKTYYGNVLAFPAAISTAGELSRNPMGYVVQLLKKAKDNVTQEYMRSLADLMHIKGRPCLVTGGRSFVISNLTRAGLDQVDFGWGRPVYSGTSGELPGIVSFYMPYKNKRGERGVLFPICLPVLAMERFIKELHLMLGEFSGHPAVSSGSSVVISSSL